MQSRIGIGVCALSFVALAACAGLGSHSAEKDLAQLTEMMTGSFSSEAQHAADSKNYFDIRLHMAPIWTSSTDGKWLYVEQAVATKLDKPYRQRVYHLHAKGDDIVSDVYVLPGDPLRFTGAWAHPELLKEVTPDKLTPREGCSIHLKKQKDGTFKGGTEGQSCPSELAGAKYATSEATITDTMMISWDRGFDESGKQVWGATQGGYQFAKQVK